MATKHRTITQLLRRNYNRDKKRELALDWSTNRETDFRATLDRLAAAVTDDDFNRVTSSIDQLEQIVDKLFSALPGVINLIFDADKVAAEFKDKKIENEKNTCG